MYPRQLPLPLLIALLPLSAVMACGDGERRRIGDTCDGAAQCESGICIQNLCVAPIGAACESAELCESGVCLDGICTTESIDEEAAPFFFINPGFAIEDHGDTASLIPRQVYSDGFRIGRDGLTPATECSSDAFIRRSAAGDLTLTTHRLCDVIEDEDAPPLPFTHAAGRISIDVPAETSENPFGLTETQRPTTVDLFAADARVHPADADLLIGQFLRDYTIDHEGGAGQTEGREINLVAAIRHSDGATSADLDGGWGVVYLNMEADRDNREINFESGFFAANHSEGAIHFGAGRTYRASQGFGEGGSVDFETYAREPESSLPVMVQSSGRLEVGGGDEPLAGAVNATADFLALTAATPPVWSQPPEGDGEPEVDSEVGYLEYETILAVRRASDPLLVLAGHTYQVIRQGWLAADVGFGVLLNRDTTSLTFSPDGGRADLSGEDTSFYSLFSGTLTREDEAIDLPQVDVTVDAETSSFRLMSPDGAEVLATGFARTDGRLFLLIDVHAGDGDGVSFAQLGLSIGVCLTCD